MRLSLTKIAAVTAAAALLLSGCASKPAAEPEAKTTEKEVSQTFPRTIKVPAGEHIPASTLEIAEEPTAIAALDYESAETAAELGLADKLVLVPEAVTNKALGSHIAELSKVETKFPVSMTLNAETVINAAPDLVLMSPRHGQDTTIGKVLTDSGITTLQLPHAWTDKASMLTNIELIGKATGADAAAAKLIKTLDSGLKGAKAKAQAPRVLVLSNQAGRPFVTAGKAFPLELLKLAGAKDVSGELGIQVTGPITAEQIVQANPDAILLVDMNGSGEGMFQQLLKNPAVAALPGAQQTMLVQGKDVQALGLTGTVAGLKKLTKWVQELS